jgi:hypothetical protein
MRPAGVRFASFRCLLAQTLDCGPGRGPRSTIPPSPFLICAHPSDLWFESLLLGLFLRHLAPRAGWKAAVPGRAPRHDRQNRCRHLRQQLSWLRKERSVPRKERPVPRKDGSVQRKECSVQRKERSVQRKERSVQRKDGSVQRKECSVPRKERPVPRMERSVQRKERPVPRKDSTVPKKDPADLWHGSVED